MELNVFVSSNTTVFAIFNTISSETPRWKCFEKLLIPDPTNEEEIAIDDTAIISGFIKTDKQ